MSAFSRAELDALERAGGFLRLLSVERTGVIDSGDRPIWELGRPLFFYSLKRRQWLMVPARFRTNYASVPRLPFVYWWYGDRCWEEPALHDQLYTDHAAYVVTFDADGKLASVTLLPMTRQEADDIFLEACLLNPQTPDGMDYAMHRGVRIGGQSSWDDPSTIAQIAYQPELQAA